MLKMIYQGLLEKFPKFLRKSGIRFAGMPRHVMIIVVTEEQNNIITQFFLIRFKGNYLQKVLQLRFTPNLLF